VISTRRHAVARSGLGLVAVLLLALGAGCGSDSGDAELAPSEGGSSGTPGPETTQPPLSSIPPPTMQRPTTPPAYPSDQFKPVTVSGRVSRSDGCVDLVTPTIRWTLLGDLAANLEDGVEVEVYGLPSPQLESTCGDSPLAVREIRLR
jgi:hypothetical protein